MLTRKTRTIREIQQQLQAHCEEEIFDEVSDLEEDAVENLTNSDTDEEVTGSEKNHSASSDSDFDIEAEPAVKITKISSRNKKHLYGKNKYKWTFVTPECRERSPRITSHLPSAKGDAINVRRIEEAWSLLMPDELLSIIVKHTNAEIARKRSVKKNVKYQGDVELIELKAVLGILYFSGLHKDSRSATNQLWNAFSSTFYRATMPRNRFIFLLGCMRFDDKTTRQNRCVTDKLAPIREVWDMFIKNCQKYYSPHQYCTIDEQLLGFRGRCAFRVYMRSKSDRYGLKIVTLNDARTYYLLNASPYVGKVETQPFESVPSFYVRTLTEPIHGSGRNITTDNWFTSVSIVENMKINFNLTMVGTIRKDKLEIPSEFEQSSNIGAAKFAYSNNKTLVSYCPKKIKSYCFYPHFITLAGMIKTLANLKS